MIFARALPEKARVTETYEVDQVISVNPRRTRGKQHAGRIEITIPYDGLHYFTRRAAKDVELARGGSRPVRTRMPPSVTCCWPIMTRLRACPLTCGCARSLGSSPSRYPSQEPRT